MVMRPKDLAASLILCLGLVPSAAAQGPPKVQVQVDRASLADAQKGVAASVSFQPVMMPVTFTLDSSGRFTYEVTGSITTPAGDFSFTPGRPVVGSGLPRLDLPAAPVIPDLGANGRFGQASLGMEQYRRILALEAENAALRARVRDLEAAHKGANARPWMPPLAGTPAPASVPISDWSGFLKKLDGSSAKAAPSAPR